MKQILLIVVAIYSVNSFAQNFSVQSTDSTFYGNVTDNDFDSKFTLYNDSTAAFPMSWSVESSNLETGWDFSVCDPSLCYPKGTLSGFFNLPTTAFNRIMNLHYYPNNTLGQSTVSVKLWENAYPNDFVILTWTGIVNIVGIEEQNASYSMTAIPNPTTDKINFQYDLNSTYGENEIILYDVAGKKIDSQLLSDDKGSIQFSNNLNPGIYFYVLNSNGKAVIRNKVILK